MKLSIGCDHAGYLLKDFLKNALSTNYEFIDFGTNTAESVDYPDFAHAVANSVSIGESTLGILICGSANGVAITANKHPEIRAAIAWTPEIAQLARNHNDANIICIPARFVSHDLALEIVKTFLNSIFEGGRHQTRVNKIQL